MQTDALPVDEALALATVPGGCAGNRYPVFVEIPGDVAAGFARGSHCAVEFMLPGKPGRWRATGEVVCSLSAPTAEAPSGLGLELLGLALTGDAFAGAATETEASTDAPTEASVEASTEAPAEASGEAPPEAQAEAAEAQAEAPTEAAAEAPDAATAEAEAAQEEPDFDASALEISLEEVASMLGDLLGREVVPRESDKLTGGFEAHDVIASYRDDDGDTIFCIAFDKPGAARIGGALTMMGVEGINEVIEADEALGGEPHENALEVLNIMSALFHEADSPHVVLAETVTGADLPDAVEGRIQAVLDAKAWSLCLAVDIEDYGPAEVYLVAK